MRELARLCVVMAAMVLLMASAVGVAFPPEPQILINAVNAAQATAPVTATIPADPVARMKFPGVSAPMIDGLSYVNRFVNQAIRGVSDKEQYGRADLWVMLPESSAGDCEDYVLSKYAILADLGFPPLLMRLVGVIVHKAGEPPEGHAILELMLPDGSRAFLDNRFSGVMTRPELEAQGYQFVPWEKA